MTFTLAARKPRNPLVVPSRQRKAGRHRPTEGARRLQARATLRREISRLRPSP